MAVGDSESVGACITRDVGAEGRHTFVGSEAVFVDQVRSDERSRPAESCFAVHGDGAAFRDDAVGQVDEAATHVERGIRTVVKVHLDVVDPSTGEMGGVVQFLVQAARGDERVRVRDPLRGTSLRDAPNHHLDVLALKLVEHVSERSAHFSSRSAARPSPSPRRARSRPSSAASSSSTPPRFDWTRKRDKARRNPVPVARLDFFGVLVRGEVEGGQVEQVVLQGAVDAVQDWLRVQVVVGARVAGVAIRLLWVGPAESAGERTGQARGTRTHQLEGAQRMQAVGYGPSHDDHLFQNASISRL